MRILWWSALALLLCLAVTSALRTQTDVTPRVSRRFPNSNRNPINANKTEDVAPTSRAQFSRRREVTTIRSKPTDNVSRTRSRSKVTETSSSLTNPSEVQTERTEQFDSRKSNNRIRNRRPVIDEANFDTTLSREKVKSRSRQTSRYSTPQTIQPTQSLPTPSLVETSTRTPIEITNYDDSSKGIKEVTSQFKRRSSTIRTVETTSASRVRGRINTRSDIKPLDLEVSGTANALTSAPRDPTTVRNGEIRNSRKLKYRTRQTETDTNLTGEGIASNERKFNETRQPIYNQSVFKKISRSSTENIVEQYTEKSIGRTAKVIKRPVSRRKVKSTIKAEKSKPSEEVSEDDNYPESFKALIQAKNASTHTSSPSSESLSVKESQKVFQTLTTTPQSFLTTPDVEKHTLLRNKLNAEDDKNDTQNDTLAIVETVATTTEESIVKPAEYRLRGTYTPRIKTLTTSSAPGIQTSTLTPSTQRSYKFSRKAKSITTQTPLIESSPKTKRLETNLYYKKPVRSSFYPKRNSTRNSNVNPDIPKITVTERSNNIKNSINYKSRQILPRTSYYSRLRSSTANVVTITEPSAKDVNEVFFADKKMENTVEVPLIYTSFNSPFNTSVSVNSLHRQDDTNISQTPFIIQVNSKESSENGTDNEIISKIEETETERSTIFATTTQKYHATYKDNNKVYVNENKENGVSTLQPPIRNIQTRKFSRKPTKQREEYSIVTQKYRDRNLRKYSDTFSKTTEASSNGIIAESDKPKSKFSSKYRASYLDKPFYKPTVPTITTSTAWLKFFVTDHHLTKSVEGPNWFDEEDLLSLTTQPMPRQNTTSPTCLHETSFQPVSSSALNIKDRSSLGITTTNMPPADKSTASHVLSLRTTTMLPSVDEILLNSISSATKEEMVISSMTSSTSEPRILTLDIDPETKQIRTEKPDDVNGNAIFKFIPIDQVTVSDLESNVLKLGSTKMPITLTTDIQMSTIPSIAESSTQSQVQNSMTNEDLTSTVQTTTDMFSEPNKSATTEPVSSITESILPPPITTPVQIQITTEQVEVVTSTTTNPITATDDPVTLLNIAPISTTQAITSTQVSNNSPFTVTTPLTKHNLETASSNQNEAELLQSLLREIGRTPKNLNGLKFSDRLTEVSPKNNNDQLLQSILAGGALNSKTLMNKAQTTTSRSIEDEIRQFEEDTKLLKALLQATGRNPAELNLPSLDEIKKVAASGTTVPVTTIPPSTTMITTTVTPTTTFRTTTTTRSTTTNRPLTTIQSTTMSINEDIRKLQEDTKLLQALLQATRNKNTVNLPVISGITSNVRIASNPFTTSLESNPTTPVNLRPVYTTRPLPIITTLMPGTVTVSTLQPQQQSGDDFGISTTFQPFNERSTTTIRSIGDRSTTSRNPKSITTEMPSTSTFSDEEDLIFLQNLKSVLSTKTGDGDPETALANRVIALAVEKSLNEIQTGKVTTTNRPTTTTRTTTTTRRITTTVPPNTPSIEDDIKQFEQDTKLLQALLKATGQDPSKLNIPTLPPTNKPVVGIDSSKSGNPTTVKPYGVKIAVKDELKNEQDDAKLLQTLIKLQDAQETTTQRSKIALTGQSSDEALKKLLQQAQPTGMLSEATKSSVSLSTEYGNSNDALLAALLKEQGFGPTTALLNQVVVTPKARRTTTRPPPPPPPAPRRPVLDGLAWLWQQWRETGPGPGGARPNRRPAPSERPSPSSGETSSRVNWFGSGPFVGNADEKPSSNRIPLEPPSAVTEQGPGRGQLVSAAINVTRAFSQFLGAAIQGAAQTVQSVFKYGQRAATDTYTNGSG